MYKEHLIESSPNLPQPQITLKDRKGICKEHWSNLRQMFPELPICRQLLGTSKDFNGILYVNNICQMFGKPSHIARLWPALGYLKGLEKK